MISEQTRLARFWDNTTKTDQCWEWTGWRTGKMRYGAMQVRGKILPAHRFSYIVHHGPIPDGLCVCHRCDNPGCVNPAHLFLGTKGDNNRDMMSKGRIRHGRKAKLIPAQIQQIRKKYAAGCRQKDLAREFGVSPQNICMIVANATWKHLEKEAGIGI